MGPSSLLREIDDQERNVWSAISTYVSHDNHKTQWSREIYNEFRGIIRAFAVDLSQEDLEAMLASFLSAFQIFRQLQPDIDSLIRGGLRGSRKVRSVIIPLCSSLIEGCYVNLARAILIYLSNLTSKRYSEQNDLNPIVGGLKKNGFLILADVPKIGLRNAISHGGVSVKGDDKNCRIEYTYTIGKKRYYEHTSIFELERLVFGYIDTIKGLIIGFCEYFNEVSAQEAFSLIQDNFVRYMYYGLDVSNSTALCIDVNEAPINAQITFLFEAFSDDDEDLIAFTENALGSLRRTLPGFKNYCVSFSHFRLAGNFFRAKAEEIDSFNNSGCPTGSLIASIIKANDYLWFGLCKEHINVFEAEYFRFPYFENDNLCIYDIEDVSGPDRKRLKAKAYIGKDALDRDSIIALVMHAIEQIRPLYNPPCPTMEIKHGFMDADCIYLDVYKSISNRDMSLMQNNDNFVCEVEYCSNIDFRLKESNGFIAYLYQNKEWITDEVKFLWRERKHLTQVRPDRIGRNDPCLCGSGKKYKKCCGAHRL